MKTMAAIALMVLMGAAPCRAQARMPEPSSCRLQRRGSRAFLMLSASAAILIAMDSASTIRGVSSGKMVESNPIYGPRPTAGRVIATDAAETAVFFWLVRRLKNRNHSRLAYSLLAASIAIEAACDANNLYLIRRMR
jgi:hypothetical protein